MKKRKQSHKQEENPEEAFQTPNQLDDSLSSNFNFAAYEKFLKSRQYSTYSMSPHHHYFNYEPNSIVEKEKVLRLAQEHSSLSTSLPFSWSSSVFVLADDEKMDLMQALITGPSDTPYGRNKKKI